MSGQMKVLDQVKETLLKMKPEFEGALPKYISFDRFYNSIINTLTINPKLLDNNIPSLYSACMKAAVDGLIIDSKEAAFVPRKGMIKYEPMIQGIVKKARNSGEILTIDAVVVHKNDEYDSWVDEQGQHFKHRKAKADRGEPVLTYAYAKTKDGGLYFEEIDEKQMMSIKACCKSDETPWNGPFSNEMRRKSAIKRLNKYRLPSSSDIDAMLEDEEEYTQETVADEAPIENEPKASRLDKIIDNLATPSQGDLSNIIDTKQVNGVVEAVSTKNNRFSFKIDGLVYRTTDKSVIKVVEESVDNKVLISVFFNESVVEEKTIREVSKAEYVKAEDVIVDTADIPL